MERISDLSNEERLLILCSRITLSREEEQEVKDILQDDVNMFHLIALGIRHKVIYFLGKHLKRLDVSNNINFQYKRILDHIYMGNKKRNESIFSKMMPVLETINKNQLVAIPLKGAVMVPHIYKDYGLRGLNDLDFLIDVNQSNKISDTLNSLGYYAGKYIHATDEIEYTSRKQELTWRMYAGNLHPHIKKFDDEYLKYLNIDFSYDVDLNGDLKASQGLLNSVKESELMGKRPWLWMKRIL